MLAKLRDIGGKFAIPGSLGPILGPNSAILWVMLKLSCAMVGHVEAIICQMLFGYVVGFVSRASRFQVGFGELCWRVKCKD